MKKLVKKSQQLIQTVEAYYVCYYCGCACPCYNGAPSATQYSYALNGITKTPMYM